MDAIQLLLDERVHLHAIHHRLRLVALVVDYLNTVDVSKPVLAQVDWLLISIFGVMSLLIMWRADIRSDSVIVAVGFVGGLVIESWGTQTHLWTYYTSSARRCGSFPAWPIASLSIDRLYKFLDFVLGAKRENHEELKNTKNYQLLFTILYWLIFPSSTSSCCASSRRRSTSR